VKLLDSPGIVYPNTQEGATPVAAALQHAVKLEKLKDPITPVQEILNRCPVKKLMEVYSTTRFTTVQDFLKNVATQRGKLKKGGLVDLEAAARLVLHDWSIGRIPYFTNPPKRSGGEHESAEVVAGWGAEFNAAEVFKHESHAVIAGLPSMDDEMYIQTESAGATRINMEEMETACQPSTAQAGGQGMDQDEDEDDEDDMDADTAMNTSNTGKKSKVDLYADEGIYNPKAAKNKKKQAKKMKDMVENFSVGGEDDDEDGSDFDFEEDYVSNNVDGDESEEEDDEEEGMDDDDDDDDDDGDEEDMDDD